MGERKGRMPTPAEHVATRGPDSRNGGAVAEELVRVAAAYNARNCAVFLAVIGSIWFLGRDSGAVIYPAALGLALIVNLVRLVLSPILLARAGRSVHRHRIIGWLKALLVAGAILNALTLATVIWLRFPVEDDVMRLSMIVISSALAGGAVGVVSPLRRTALIYISLLLLPTTAQIALSGDYPLIVAILGIGFWVAMVSAVASNSQMYAEIIISRQRVEGLLEELKANNDAITALNKDLERRVEERTEDLREKAEQAAAADRAKSVFLASISHELRTPLNGVIGMAQVMASSDLPGEQRRNLAVITSSAESLTRIINDVLDISRAEAGHLAIDRVAFDADALLDSLHATYAMLCRERGLACDLVVDAPLGWRSGDPVRLKQILGNLLANALKFTEAGGVILTVAADEDTTTLTVRDTGRGIQREDLGRIFERFQQVESGDCHIGKGAGLGLAICRHLTELMGGEITATSTPGEGATFTVTLPLPRAARPEPAAEGAAPVDPAAGGRRALVVDDNPANRQVMGAILGSLGLEVATADDGAAAVTALEQAAFDIVFMDVNMPGMDGLTATRAIRAAEAAGERPRTPIVALTASVMTHETTRYYEAGMDAVLAKPINMGELVALFESLPSALADDRRNGSASPVTEAAAVGG
jgi:signal transduction histidine kinase/FixJ family two-component response regulator